MKNIDIIKACSSLGVVVDGTEEGPKVLSKYINEKSVNKIYEVKTENEKKEKERDNYKKNLAGVNKFNRKLYDVAYNSIASSRIPITLGGDHSIAIASSLAAIKRYENLGVIWFDSHGDFNTFETSVTGNLHGLPLAVLAGFEKKLLADFHSGNRYNPSNVVIVGGRDIDPWEWPNLEKAGVTVFSTEDIKEQGAEAIARKAFEIAGNGTNGIHISYDVDLIDPEVATGVSIPAVDGIDEETAYKLVDVIVENKDRITSLDLVEFNPINDVNGKTETIVKNILNKIIDGFNK